MNRPIAVIITHVIPYPPSAGNEIRILKMLRWLHATGYYTVMILNHHSLDKEIESGLLAVVDEIHFAEDYKGQSPQHSAGRTLDCCMRMLTGRNLLKGISKFIGILDYLNYKLESRAIKRWLCPPELITATAAICHKLKPDIVIAEYIFTARCLDFVTNGAMKIIDTHDMFSRKKEQVHKFGVKDLLLCTRKEERNLLLKSDLIIAIQSNEATLFEKLVPERSVITVGIDFDVISQPEENQLEPATVLVVGSESPLNVHGLNEFYLHAWPEIRLRCSTAILKIVGKIGKHFNAEDQSIIKIGWVTCLDDEYRRATVVINPVPSGTGLKIKSVEALCRGKALVSTKNGVEGLSVDVNDDVPYIACDSWKEFADATVALLESTRLRKSFESKALAYARETFNTDKIYQPLLHALCDKENRKVQHGTNG